MKDLIDLKKGWLWFINKCRTNAGLVLLIVAGFIFGYALAHRDITDDCKFMGNFRDGPYVFNCSVRQR